MLDHVGLSVADFARSKAFYAAALKPLGLAVRMEFPTGPDCFAAGIGTPDHPGFWISNGKPPQTGIHVAFAAADRASVDAFYKAAMAAGGADNGAPGLRPDYHPNYYGAFVLDPDGNNVEAVCHKPA